MIKPKSKTIYFGIAFAIGALALTFLLSHDKSPFYRYFLFHEAPGNIWIQLNLLPFIVATVVSGRSHGLNQPVFWLAMCAQWFLIGMLVSIVVRKLRS